MLLSFLTHHCDGRNHASGLVHFPNAAASKGFSDYSTHSNTHLFHLCVAKQHQAILSIHEQTTRMNWRPMDMALKSKVTSAIEPQREAAWLTCVLIHFLVRRSFQYIPFLLLHPRNIPDRVHD